MYDESKNGKFISWVTIGAAATVGALGVATITLIGWLKNR